MIAWAELSMLPRKEVASVLTLAAHTPMMSAIITAYSTDVGPASSTKKFLILWADRIKVLLVNNSVPLVFVKSRKPEFHMLERSS